MRRLDSMLRWGFTFTTIILKKLQGGRTMEIATKLLVCAGTLMLIAGVIFGFLGQWLSAALIWAGALGCLAAALNFKKRKDK